MSRLIDRLRIAIGAWFLDRALRLYPEQYREWLSKAIEKECASAGRVSTQQKGMR